VQEAWSPQAEWTAARPVAAPGVRAAAAHLDALARELVAAGTPGVRGVAIVSFLVCDPVSPLYNRSSPVGVSEIADRARAGLLR
jgi:hypothetical protein